jgi:hypothetical protein
MSEKISNILQLIEDADSKKKKVKILKKNDNFVLRTILQGNFNDDIKFGMPTGLPPLKELDENTELTNLDDELMKKICQTIDRKIHQWARERTFTECINNLDEEERDIIIAMKDKTISELYPSITYELVKEAYPKIL